MLKWALIALVVAVVAALVGFGGLADIAWTVAVIFAVIAGLLFVWHLITGRAT